MDFIKYNVAIVGGGASGLMAAVELAKSGKGLKVAVFEHHSKVGRKLMATGNGRCNLTNKNLTVNSYRGGTEYLEIVLQKYNSNYITNYFSDIGLVTYADDQGRVYPLSNNVSSVYDCITDYAFSKGVDCYCDVTVKKIIPEKKGYTLLSDDYRIFAENVILACGGKASAKLSTDGLGYNLLKSLDISVTNIMPSLVQVPCSNRCLTNLKGLRVKGEISLEIGNKIIGKESGEIQFAKGALSGISVFQLSGYVSEYFSHKKNKDNIAFYLDLMPNSTAQECLELLKSRANSLHWYKLSNFFDGFLHKRVASALYSECGIKDIQRTASTLTKNEITRLAHCIKGWKFTPTNAGEFDNAQVTSGGASCKEIDFNSCQSKKYSHLYIVGELVDVDGICGGYNLHWAWSSGIMAAKNILKGYGKTND
ncbi:MAG: aminoacetone oxidase family FAD-binding enzyme [Oscillospiraceae bacterium]|nr:aminoacetone oxidase family FAD-binding enzyme [Oscillospiraceae bacterium]